jgi:hypothetical protein
MHRTMPTGSGDAENAFYDLAVGREWVSAFPPGGSLVPLLQRPYRRIAQNQSLRSTFRLTGTLCEGEIGDSRSRHSFLEGGPKGLEIGPSQKTNLLNEIANGIHNIDATVITELAGKRIWKEGRELIT